MKPKILVSILIGLVLILTQLKVYGEGAPPGLTGGPRWSDGRSSSNNVRGLSSLRSTCFKVS